MAFPGLAREGAKVAPLVALAFQAIDESYTEPLSLTIIAARLAISSGYLSRITKRETGATINDWIIQRRMVEARRLLFEHEQTIQDIASKVGYPDPKHFRHHFHQTHHCTPRQWQAEHCS